ncbi:MAG TPA: transposase [Anaerolineales bacterium]|jgi:hypothetical protein
MTGKIIPFAQELRPLLPTVVGNVDYKTLRQQLDEIDALLRESGLQEQFIGLSVENWFKEATDREPTALEQQKFQERSRRALRCMVLRTLLQESFRVFTCNLAGNPLYQWFCCIDAIDVVRVPSKSELQRFSHWLPAEQMRKLMDQLLGKAAFQPQELRLCTPLDVEDYFLDSTALKADIHFPTDWVLLRDGVRTLMKATILIRREGLKGRMRPPEEFLRQMNRLCIQMSAEGRRCGSKKGRKRVLRQMKKLVKTIRCHAQRHRKLLDTRWEQTQWTRPQAEQILKRIDNVIEQLPRAQKQAHERIIGQRKVANGEKILSLYDPDINVIVRGKAGAEVEFGNTVLLGENKQGVILDYAMYRDQAPADSHLLFESMLRVLDGTGIQVGAVATDRGFASASNSRTLEEAGTYDATCPRNPKELGRRMKDKRFADMQRRRAQTEGRIGILKANFLGRPLRARGFESRELALAWGVLTHNLWALARLRKSKKQSQPSARAA